MHQKRKTKLSDYGQQLRAKQQIRRSYGVSERQFRKVFGIASSKKGITSFTLLVLLEFRLDNAVYRSGCSICSDVGRQSNRYFERRMGECQTENRGVGQSKTEG